MNGFTLTELLMGLVVIGLLSALLLPKVFQVSSEAQNRAVLKSTIQQMRMMHEKLAQEGVDLTTADGVATFWSRLDVISTCTNHADTNCKTIPVSSELGGEGWGAILKNGAYVFGINPPVDENAKGDGFWIDANGQQGPNIVGKDIIPMIRCFRPNVSTDPVAYPATGNEDLELGQMVLWVNNHYSTMSVNERPANSQNADLLWNSLWQ